MTFCTFVLCFCVAFTILKTFSGHCEVYYILLFNWIFLNSNGSNLDFKKNSRLLYWASSEHMNFPKFSGSSGPAMVALWVTLTKKVSLLQSPNVGMCEILQLNQSNLLLTPLSVLSSSIFSLMTKLLVQSLNNMHIKYVFLNTFKMIKFHDQKTLSLNFKSSRSQMFFKIDVLKNFAIFTGKHLCRSYLRTAASILLIKKLLIKYLASTDLFLIKNMTWNSFY